MRKRLVSMLLAGCMVVSLCGCGKTAAGDTATDTTSTDSGTEEAATEEAAAVPGEVFGDTVQYDPNVPINNGEDIKIDFWEWGSDELFQQIVDGYTAIHPNVQIELVNNPWEDYWTKLPLALDGKDGPAIFNIHNSYHQNIVNYCAPYDIPTEDLEKDFNGVAAHVIDGNVYYIDYGIMTGSVYYNKDMWEAAGLTDADIPKTWDDMIAVAKKLTIKDGDNIVQAGWSFNDNVNSNYLMGVNYQLGQNLFDTDNKTCVVDNDATKKVFQMLIDAYDKEGVGSKDFGTSATDSFGQGQAAMAIAWGWFNNTLQSDYPDINYGVFEIPTFDGDPYAYNRYNGESTFGINKNADEKQQAVAQDIVKYFLANDELQVKFNLAMNTFPAKTSLADNEEILSNKAMAAIADHIDKYIWPGPVPATVEDSLKIAAENVFYNDMSIDEALKTAQDTINNDLKSKNFEAVESLYKYAK
ncbi:MAG: extracellular solute-binding protein [Lachnospiraceae bacterium]|nr:extracellular solute-binding protein [Lachnospiraceae bacterium]